MLGHKRIPSREGGIEIVVEELATRMAALGHEVTCLNRKGHHVSGKEFDKAEQSTYQDVKIKSVFTLNRRGLAAMTSSFIGGIIAAFGHYQIVHFHAEGPCAMIWLPKLMGKRCICTIHGLDWQRAKWGRFAKAYIKFGERCAVKYADEMIVLSENTKQYFMSTYGRKTQFIPNGVTRPVIRPADRITRQFELEKDNYILFLGRLVPEKGLHYLIRAFQQVKTDKMLVIAGGSSDTSNYMKEMFKEGQKDKRIIFTGFIEGKILDELYSNAYLYVLPSDLEGMPLSLLEAMSYGNCCVISDIPECVSVVEDKAVRFEHSNVEDLRDTLQKLCDDEGTVYKYKTQSSQYICQKYNWDEITAETLSLYKEEQIEDDIKNKEVSLNY